MIAVAIITPVAVLAGIRLPHHHDDKALNTEAAEQQIAPELEHQLRKTSGDHDLRVTSVGCVGESRTQGHCVARVKSGGETASIGLTIHADATDGTFIWSTEP